jgi:hypothetical protein
MEQLMFIYTLWSLLFLFWATLPLKFILISKRAMLMFIWTWKKIFDKRKTFNFTKN